MFMHAYPWDILNPTSWTVVAFSQPTCVDDVLEMKQWCRAVYGEPGSTWRDDVEYGEVRFKNEKDVLLFMLKWHE